MVLLLSLGWSLALGFSSLQQACSKEQARLVWAWSFGLAVVSSHFWVLSATVKWVLWSPNLVPNTPICTRLLVLFPLSCTVGLSLWSFDHLRSAWSLLRSRAMWVSLSSPTATSARSLCEKFWQRLVWVSYINISVKRHKLMLIPLVSLCCKTFLCALFLHENRWSFLSQMYFLLKITETGILFSFYHIVQFLISKLRGFCLQRSGKFHVFTVDIASAKNVALVICITNFFRAKALHCLGKIIELEQ